jgi:molybdate transport system substrate-binding protein
VKRKPLSVVVLVGLVLASCGKSSPATKSSKVRLAVLAATRLGQVFPKIGELFTQGHPGVTFSFSFDRIDLVVARIEQGDSADVFAGSSTTYGDQLLMANKTDPYKVFCTNPLVLITPKANPAEITTLRDLQTKPARVVIASDANVLTAPLTHMALTNLDAVFGSGYAAAVLGKVVSREDVTTSIVAKVESGQADAGFVLISDVRDTGANVNVIELPAEAQAYAKFPIAVLKTSKNAAVARQFVDFVLTAPPQALLKEAGFDPPPASTP